MFRRLPGVLMFGLCFLSSTERVSGDGEKNSHERKITERDRGRRQRERDGNSSLVINACAIVCSVSLSARTKAEERRQVRHMNSV